MCANDHGHFSLNYPQINEVGRSYHMDTIKGQYPFIWHLHDDIISPQFFPLPLPILLAARFASLLTHAPTSTHIGFLLFCKLGFTGALYIANKSSRSLFIELTQAERSTAFLCIPRARGRFLAVTMATIVLVQRDKQAQTNRGEAFPCHLLYLKTTCTIYLFIK